MNEWEFTADGLPEPFSDMFNAHAVQFKKGKAKDSLVQSKNPIQDDRIVLLAKSGTRGLVRVPHYESECRRVFQKYERFILERDRCIRELIEDRTADEDLQEKIHAALTPLFSRKRTTKGSSHLTDSVADSKQERNCSLSVTLLKMSSISFSPRGNIIKGSSVCYILSGRAIFVSFHGEITA